MDEILKSVYFIVTHQYLDGSTSVVFSASSFDVLCKQDLQETQIYQTAFISFVKTLCV